MCVVRHDYKHAGNKSRPRLNDASKNDIHDKDDSIREIRTRSTSNSAFTLGRMSLDKSLHIWLKTLRATLFSGSVHTSHTWSDLSSDMR